MVKGCFGEVLGPGSRASLGPARSLKACCDFPDLVIVLIWLWGLLGPRKTAGDGSLDMCLGCAWVVCKCT